MARSLRAGAVGALIALGLLVPKTAHADAYLGSTMLLSHAPDASEPVAADSVFWLTALANDRPGLQRYLVTQPGQILQFEVRGYSGGSTPAPIHFQDLRPSGAGTLSIVASSQAYSLPTVDGVWSFDSDELLRAGRRLPRLQRGGRVPGERVRRDPGLDDAQFSLHNGTMNGDLVTPTRLPNVELLMASYEGTGPHASPLCGGIQGIELHVTAHRSRVAAGGACAAARVHRPAGVPGHARTHHDGGGDRRPREVRRHRARAVLAGRHASGDASVTIDAVGLRLLHNHHGTLAVTIDRPRSARAARPTRSARTATLTG